MPGRTKKKAAKPTPGFSILGDEAPSGGDESESLSKDESGRLKIKKQYKELLGVRMGKLAGRVLNRERIDKTVEGVYFICVGCGEICHNLDEGLVEDPDNLRNTCLPCSQEATAKP